MVSRKQLLAQGLTEHMVKTWISSGILHRVHHGVYAFGNPRLVTHGRLYAALLSGGDGSFLSHRTIAAAYGLRAMNLRRIEVTVPAGSTRGASGLILHRTAREPLPGEVVTFNALRGSSVARMLVELSARETPRELERLVTEAARKRLLDPQALQEVVERHGGRPGVRRLRDAIAAYRPGPDRKSDLERAFDRLLSQHPEVPPPLRNVALGRWEIDCYWPAERLAVELDGRPYHVAIRDLERDRLKDTWLMRMNIRPMRVTDRRFDLEPHQVLEDISSLLALGKPASDAAARPDAPGVQRRSGSG